MTGVLHSFSAEWLKLRKRPAVWVLGAILVALAAVFQYAVFYFVVATLPKNANIAGGLTADDLRASLHPLHWVQTTLGTFATGSFGGPVAVILGVLAYGSEYGWSTLRTVFTQRPGRLATVAGKVGVVAAILAIYTLAVFAGSAGLSAAIGAVDGALSPWPSVMDVVKGLVSGWLILGMWAGFGLVLSVLFRQSALAIGLGLIYAIVLEGVVLNLAAQFSWVRSALPWFPGWNATSLVRSFGSALPATGTATVPQAHLVGGVQAAMVVAAFAVVFVAIAAALLQSRDVA
jgi:ABC-2 type transport system permease protein